MLLAIQSELVREIEFCLILYHCCHGDLIVIKNAVDSFGDSYEPWVILLAICKTNLIYLCLEYSGN
jgi:hypothetical protein